MDLECIYDDFVQKLENSQILRNESMKKHTSFKVGGNVDIFVKAKSKSDIKYVLESAVNNNNPIYILGNGSNVLVKDEGIKGIVLCIGLENIKIEDNNEGVKVTAEAGVKNSILANVLLEKEVTGFEFAAGIPGTIGGAVKMNAGAHGKEMKDIVETTTYMDFQGNIKTISLEQHEFSYRHSVFENKKVIILETTLNLNKGNGKEISNTMKEYLAYRKEKQPINYPSAGSTFKRGKDFITAKLIDECGLKGTTIGGAKISDLHAGFIVNTGNATANDIIELIKYTKEEVYKKTGKNIDLEIEIIGD